MKGSKSTVLTLAERCKNILASNWQGQLNTIKADAKGSKADIYTSKVKYMFKSGKPLIWIREKDLHNTNTVIDQRGSFSVISPCPAPLPRLLRSMEKLPVRVALTGDLVPLGDEKASLAEESLRESIVSEHEAITESSYSVSGITSSSVLGFTSRSENLVELLSEDEIHRIYNLNLRSCMFIDGNGGTHDIDLENMDAVEADPLSYFAATLIDGINQSQARRKALIIFCFTYLNASVKDALLLSVDRKGLDVLAKVQREATFDGSYEYEWKEFRVTLKEEASDIETFCRQLVEMEEDAVEKISSFSGLG